MLLIIISTHNRSSTRSCPLTLSNRRHVAVASDGDVIEGDGFDDFFLLSFPLSLLLVIAGAAFRVAVRLVRWPSVTRRPLCTRHDSLITTCMQTTFLIKSRVSTKKVLLVYKCFCHLSLKTNRIRREWHVCMFGMLHREGESRLFLL